MMVVAGRSQKMCVSIKPGSAALLQDPGQGAKCGRRDGLAQECRSKLSADFDTPAQRVSAAYAVMEGMHLQDAFMRAG